MILSKTIEFYIKESGYWVDGYDSVNNVVYEFDESHHYFKGEVKLYYINRKLEIMNYLKCDFINYSYKDYNLDDLI